HLTQSQALLVGLEATRALDYAHRRGFVHRDVKPANIMFGDDGRLRIADFGLARALAEAAWTEPQGAVLGTARYASPEQAQGQPVDGRADVYSLGLVLIEAVTGSVPFAADTTIATLMARVGKPVVVPDTLGPLQKPLTRAGLPDPADRPDAGELAVALMASAENLPRPEPLPLATATPIVDLTEAPDDRDATMLGAALGGSRLAEPGEVTMAEGPAVPPVTSPATLPDYLDDDFAVEAPERHRRRWPWLVVATLLAVLVGGGAAYAWSEARTPVYEVPTLVSLTETQARAALEEYGFEVERQDRRADGSTPGTVLATDPEAGQSLDEGGPLVLYVSIGNELATVPTDLVNRTIDDARVVLDAAGSFTVALTEVESEDVGAGIVIAVGEGVPTELPKGSEVPLTVSKGPRPRDVPTGLEGQTYEAAAAAVEAVQLTAVRLEDFSDDVPAGQVIALNPDSGTAPRGSDVEIVVSIGPDLVAVPTVAGSTLEQAVAALEAAGFAVGDAFGPANGQPFETDPPAGTMLRRGTAVAIFLRR
ncbi:MAG: PASTA domain-containing protein, partial [Acidimicrobiales bacterium]